MNKIAKRFYETAPAYPLIFLTVVFVGLPLLYIFVLSFLTRGPQGAVEFKFTIENYTRILDPLYLNVFLRSIYVATIICFSTLAIGYPFAYFTARLPKQFRVLVLFFVMVPFLTSSLIRLYGWMVFLSMDGVLNKLLMFLHITKEPITFLYNYGAVLVGTVYVLLPLMILPIYNSVEKLDESLIEASRDLGANKTKTFFKVTLPLTLPGVVGGITLVFVPAVGLFFVSDLLGGAKTVLIGNLVRNQMLKARDWPFGASLSVVMVIGVLIFFAVYMALNKKIDGGNLF